MVDLAWAGQLFAVQQHEVELGRRGLAEACETVGVTFLEAWRTAWPAEAATAHQMDADLRGSTTSRDLPTSIL